MRSDFPRWIPFWLLFSGLACVAAVFAEPCAAVLAAEQLSVLAQVDKREVRAGEKLTFSVTIAGRLREAPTVRLNSFEGFHVLSTSQSQQIQLHGKQTQQSLTLTYTLAPLAPGSYRLGPVKVEYEGQTFETQPIEIKVVEGPSSSAPEAPRRPKLKGGVIL